MTFQAKCRKLSEDYDKFVVCSFPGMAPLYEDFARFISHDQPERGLAWPDKKYRIDGKFIKFGNKYSSELRCLIHARGIKRSTEKNYKKWGQLVTELVYEFGQVGCIGTSKDMLIPGAWDCRGVPLQDLMDLMASSEIVIGGSSGTMHLSCLCGPKVVSWGDNRTYFNETLEKRYKETWNPLGADVEFITTKDWQPKIDDILNYL